MNTFFVLGVISTFCCSAVYSRPALPSQESERRVLAVKNPNLLEHIVTFAPKPYQFGYELEDGYGMSQYRSEASDGTGVVKGSYGFMDPSGIYRKVDYTADGNGYRAVVKTNEPGTANQNVADALFIVEPPPANVIAQGLSNEISPREIKD